MKDEDKYASFLETVAPPEELLALKLSNRALVCVLISHDFSVAMEWHHTGMQAVEHQTYMIEQMERKSALVKLVTGFMTDFEMFQLVRSFDDVLDAWKAVILYMSQKNKTFQADAMLKEWSRMIWDPFESAQENYNRLVGGSGPVQSLTAVVQMLFGEGSISPVQQKLRELTPINDLDRERINILIASYDREKGEMDENIKMLALFADLAKADTAFYENQFNIMQAEEHK